MARARSRSHGGAQRWLAGAGLLGFGAVIGVMLGAILDGPRMLVRRWTEEVKVLELPRPTVDAPALEEYARLQTSQPKPAAPPAQKPASKPAPEPEKRPPSEASRPEPPQTSSPQKQADPSPPGRKAPAVAPSPAETPSPEQLIAEIQRKRAAPATQAPEPVPTGAGRSGAVVQVAAYRDATAAETLVRRLRRAGYDAYLSDRRADGPNKYRVRVQPPRDSSVQALAARLEERGYGVWVTRE